ncbi:hypothetical protein CHCC5023_4319 [Bacillus paralicheniformis]|nr:hypothetical protein CHCC5023_4319 [Bacillus paralicheniformis]
MNLLYNFLYENETKIYFFIFGFDHSFPSVFIFLFCQELFTL